MCCNPLRMGMISSRHDMLSRTSRTGGQSNRRWGSKAIRIGHSLEDSSLRTRKTALSAEILLGSPKTSRSISERNSRKIRLRCIFRRTLARITIHVDLTPEVEITGYQRYQDGHGLEVRWPLPARCRCEKCGHDDVAHIEFKTSPQAIRDLNLWEQPCFWIYQAPFHRCARCNYRQHIIPPFKRKDVSYTYRFEQFVLRSLIGSTADEVARRLGISAETVDRIVENQLTEDRQIDPQRVITDIGLDELSLKKRHRLYVTLMTDLSDPTRPQILAVERGRDTTATLKCLDRLTQEQRQQVRTHRVDMGPAYPAACALRLPHSRAVTDRFHVAKKFNEVVDSLRKNITREYKAKLTKDQRKAFRSHMWAFRRDPESLSAEEKQALEALVEKIPALR